jgi:hypothetical protein
MDNSQDFESKVGGINRFGRSTFPLIFRDNPDWVGYRQPLLALVRHYQLGYDCNSYRGE